MTSQEPDAGPYEPTLGGDRLRHEAEPPREAGMDTATEPALEADPLAHIPESTGRALSPVDERLTDIMATAIVVLGFLLIVAVGVAILATVVRYTWRLFHP
ncbi:MAG: hypothetical protein ACK46X_21530 [Candidatus Sericytochromatia bacterium]